MIAFMGARSPEEPTVTTTLDYAAPTRPRRRPVYVAALLAHVLSSYAVMTVVIGSEGLNLSEIGPVEMFAWLAAPVITPVLLISNTGRPPPPFFIPGYAGLLVAAYLWLRRVRRL